MGRTCVAPGCKAGYKSSKENEKVTIYRFKEHWKKYIPRKDWLPTENCGLCEQHFVASDYTIERCNNTNEKRKNILGSVIKPRLKPDAVPSVFPNLPSYFNENKTQRTFTENNIV